MKIKKTLRGREMIVVPEGRLDTVTAPILEGELKSSMAEIDVLVLDFDELEYISSAGLRVLLLTQKAITKKKGNMTIRNANEMVMEVFEITGFADILTIE